MNESLGTYLRDHLAGAAYAIQLVEFIRDQHSGDDLGRFAAEILVEIKKDRDTLRHIAERIGASGSALKEAASWVGEKISRFKLGNDADSGLATFEALELLAIGILGKRALWRALAAVAPSDPRLPGVNFFETLAISAEKQHDKVEQRRVIAAKTALRANLITDSYRQNASYRTNQRRTLRKATIAGSLAITAGVLVTVALLPDLIRHMKLRAM